jgi:hypothetical protein
MNISRMAVIAVAALVVAGPTAVSADSYWEILSARAMAAGPTNARNAELLDRYGCMSGTRPGFCEGEAASVARAGHVCQVVTSW